MQFKICLLNAPIGMLSSSWQIGPVGYIHEAIELELVSMLMIKYV